LNAITAWLRIVLGERELSLLRTLRNQAVMAFKTAG